MSFEISIEEYLSDAEPARSAHVGRVDFHLHSYASNVTDYYASNALSIPESYSDPIELHRKLSERGMSLVTLTDHNSIDGVRVMLDAGLPNVFFSAEMTTTFPEDGCNIHVTAANISESQFDEIDRLRGNVYEMVAYLDRCIAEERSDPDGRRIAYFMTHPLMSTQNRPYGREGALSLWHIERAMLLFECIETHNGSRARSGNDLTLAVLRSLDEKRIEELANRHDLAPKGEMPWRKAIVGGSDDHSGINPGRTWTEFAYEGECAKPNDVIDSIRRRETRTAGIHGGPVTLAHALVKLVYDGQHSVHRSGAAQPVRMGDSLNLLLSFAFDGESGPAAPRKRILIRTALRKLVRRTFASARGRGTPFEEVLLEEAQALLTDRDFRKRVAANAITDDKIFLIIQTLLDRLFVRYAERIRRDRSGNVVKMIKEAIALISSNAVVSFPYFVSYAISSSDKLLNRDVRKAFDLREEEKLVLVTDTLFDVNGVALTIRKVVREAEVRNVDLTVVTALSREERGRVEEDPEIRAWVQRGRLEILPAIYDAELPEYDGLRVRLVSFLELLRYAQESGFTKMQVSTPGPVGAAGLMAAKLLGIETSSTYHTSFPEYVEAYTRDLTLEALAWKAMIFFYHAVDEVVVPSHFIGQLLRKRGLRKRNLLILDRWVDLERFSPERREAHFWRRFGVEDASQTVRFIYVGRLGMEKNLDLLADAFQRLHAEAPEVRLVFVGDGPFRAALEERLAGFPVLFTGFLPAEDVARALASADAKIFPSTTDTWGNAPLEAQASGLPVVVTDKGGPQELMAHEETGFRIPGGDAHALFEAMRSLMDPALRQEMGMAARAFAEANDIREPYSAILDADGYRRRRKAGQRIARLHRASDPVH